MAMLNPFDGYTFADFAGQVVTIDNEEETAQFSGPLERDYDASFLRECGIRS